MSTHCVFARRLTTEYIQYGCIIDDGYLEMAGCRLANYYKNDENIDWLFDQGDIEDLGIPGGEKISWFFTMRPYKNSKGLKVCKGENAIDPWLMFTDYHYIYELDKKWYYMRPYGFRNKISLDYVLKRMKSLSEDRDADYLIRKEIDSMVIHHILYEYPKGDEEFKKILENIDVDDIYKKACDDDFPINYFQSNNPLISNYFDKWVLLKTNTEDTEITEIIVKKNSENHVETCCW